MRCINRMRIARDVGTKNLTTLRFPNPQNLLRPSTDREHSIIRTEPLIFERSQRVQTSRHKIAAQNGRAAVRGPCGLGSTWKSSGLTGFLCCWSFDHYVLPFVAGCTGRQPMSDRTEAARFMRESAEQLRRIASLQSFLSPKLLNMVRELEERAEQLDDAASKDAA